LPSAALFLSRPNKQFQVLQGISNPFPFKDPASKISFANSEVLLSSN